MKTLRLPLHQMHSQTDVVDLLEKEELKPGDRLDVIIDDEDKSIILFAILMFLAAGLFFYFNKKQKEKRIAEGGRILQDLYASENAEELEREIEAEYGIQIEFINEAEEMERNAWLQRSVVTLAASYSDDEPDYSDAIVFEPNPDFNPS